MDKNSNSSKKISYAGIFKKIDDIPDLRIELENIFDGKSHKETVEYCLLLGGHILEMAKMEPRNEILESFEIMSLRGAELRGILSSALFDGGSFDRKFIIPSGLIPRCVHFD